MKPNNSPTASGSSSAPKAATTSAAGESAPTVTTPVVPPVTPPSVESAPLSPQQAAHVEFEAGVALAMEGKPLPDNASASARKGFAVVNPKTRLRTDGPTVEEYVARGYQAANYPPQGYEARLSEKAQALAAAQKIVAEANELLQNGLADATRTLGHSLRVMIANQFPESDGGRRIAEVAFEAAKNVPAGKATRENLADAISGLTTAVNHIANHSLKFPGDLDVLRSAQRKLTGVAEQYDALIVPVAAPIVTAPVPAN